MTPEPHEELSRRERQIMDIVYRLEHTTVAKVLEEMEDAPSYSAVRAFMRILEEKGHLTHTKEGQRYVYLPAHSRRKVARSAIKRVMNTFFNGSPAAVLLNLLESEELDAEEMKKLRRIVENQTERGKK